MRVIITGAAGFIGFHLAKHLLERGDEVFALDNLNNYYDPRLKQARLELLQCHNNFHFVMGDITDANQIKALLHQAQAQHVIHLAAQAGVRYSLTNPAVYMQANLIGFANVIEACRQHEIAHLIYASTSSVYGANTKLPYSEHADTNQPVSIYAASKKANELLAHSYSHLFHLPTTGLRFFTVYGPWGRPDMAFFSFTEKIMANQPLELFNHGNMVRDFTYIDDVIAGITLVLDKSPDPNNCYKIYNVGCGAPVKLGDYIAALEQALGKTAKKLLVPMQPGDVLATHADISRMQADFAYQPQVSYQEGIARFVTWYKQWRIRKNASPGVGIAVT